MNIVHGLIIPYFGPTKASESDSRVHHNTLKSTFLVIFPIFFLKSTIHLPSLCNLKPPEVLTFFKLIVQAYYINPQISLCKNLKLNLICFTKIFVGL